MKAILGNFTKISETEFRLKKDLQFADITVDEEQKIQTVQYQDSQDIEIGDILTHQTIDYEILDINADNSKYLKVSVKAEVKEQPDPPAKKFVARKMTPRKHKPVVKKPIPTPEIIEQPIPTPEITEIPQEEETIPMDKIDSAEIKPSIVEKDMPNMVIPKKKSIIKRFISYLASKLTSYSDS